MLTCLKGTSRPSPSIFIIASFHVRVFTAALATGRFADRRFALVWAAPHVQRTLADDELYGGFYQQGDGAAFADTSQYLLTTEASLRPVPVPGTIRVIPS